jgi:hypothetical protein
MWYIETNMKCCKKMGERIIKKGVLRQINNQAFAIGLA